MPTSKLCSADDNESIAMVLIKEADFHYRLCQEHLDKVRDMLMKDAGMRPIKPEK